MRTIVLKAAGAAYRMVVLTANGNQPEGERHECREPLARRRRAGPERLVRQRGPSGARRRSPRPSRRARPRHRGHVEPDDLLEGRPRLRPVRRRARRRRPVRERRRRLRARLDRGHPARLRPAAPGVRPHGRARLVHLDRGGGRPRLRGRRRRPPRARAARPGRPAQRDDQGAGHRRRRRGLPPPHARGPEHQHDAAVLARALPPDRRELRRRADGTRRCGRGRGRHRLRRELLRLAHRRQGRRPAARGLAAAREDRRRQREARLRRRVPAHALGPGVGAPRGRRCEPAAPALGLDRRQEPRLLAHALHRRPDRRALGDDRPRRHARRVPRRGRARADHLTVLDGIDQARADIAALAEAGVDLDAITSRLENDGVKQFADAYDEMLEAIGRKREQVGVS